LGTRINNATKHYEDIKMSVSKEDREAYEKGKDEADYIRDHPISYIITGGINDKLTFPHIMYQSE
jgi:hypothetical protein